MNIFLGHILIRQNMSIYKLFVAKFTSVWKSLKEGSSDFENTKILKATGHKTPPFVSFSDKNRKSKFILALREALDEFFLKEYFLNKWRGWYS